MAPKLQIIAWVTNEHDKKVIVNQSIHGDIDGFGEISFTMEI
jgi:hypothetical protein